MYPRRSCFTSRLQNDCNVFTLLFEGATHIDLPRVPCAHINHYADIRVQGVCPGQQRQPNDMARRRYDRAMRTFITRGNERDGGGDGTEYLRVSVGLQLGNGYRRRHRVSCFAPLPFTVRIIFIVTRKHTRIHAHTHHIYLQIVRARFGSSPTLVFYRNWRLPFDRMYLVTEDGQEHPTPQALKELGSIVMFQSSSWYMAIVDM